MRKSTTKVFLTLALIFLAVGGAKAQSVINKVGEQDYTSLTSLPDWHTQGCAASLAEGTPTYMNVTRNNGVTVSYNAQKMVADNISTIIGGSYIVKLRIKGTAENGKIVCLFGNWGDGNAETKYDVAVPKEWQDVEVPFTSAKAANSWVMIWVGSYDGTISIEKVGVYYTSSPLFYTYDYKDKTTFPWYHDDNWGTKPTVGSDILTATNNVQLDDPSNYTFFVADNIFTEEGKEYIVRATMKGSTAGTIKCVLGTWELSKEADLSFTENYGVAECKISDLSNANNNHVIFKIGKYVGTISLKKIEIIGGGRTIVVSSAGYATFSTDKAVDVTDIVTAYTAKYNAGKVALTPVTEVPANNAVIIEAAADVYTVPTISTASALTDNDLKVSDGNVTGDGATIYVLANGNNGVGFYLLQSGDAIPAGKAYLEIPASAPSYSYIGFGDGTTAIDGVRNQMEEVREGIFDLSGRRVANPTKGLYIVNGKKVIIK